MQKLYSCKAIQEIINTYLEKGGEVITLSEGCLGYGLTMCYGTGLKTAIIQEVCLNEWSSAHTIRFYNKMPKKYADLMEKVECEF